MQTAMINTASVPMSSSYHHQHHHHHQSPYYLMTPTRTRRGLAAAAADVGSAKSKTPSPVVGRRSGGREIPQHQQSRLAHHHADFIFSIEYDLFLKNLVGIDQASCSSTSSSPPSGAGYYHRASGGKGELWHSASFSPQSLPKARSHRPQSSSFAFPYHQQYYHQQQHQQFKRASHSLSSSASSSTSSPTRRPQPAPAAVPAQSIVQQPQSDNALNIEKKETAADVEIDEIEPENLSHQHLHALHRFRRQRDKGLRLQLRDIVISFTPKARGSILDRDHVFIRFGPDEQQALASFDFLSDQVVATGAMDQEDEDQPDHHIDLTDEADVLEQAASYVDQMRRLSFSKSRSFELTGPQQQQQQQQHRTPGPTLSCSFDEERAQHLGGRKCRK